MRTMEEIRAELEAARKALSAARKRVAELEGELAQAGPSAWVALIPEGRGPEIHPLHEGVPLVIDSPFHGELVVEGEWVNEIYGSEGACGCIEVGVEEGEFGLWPYAAFRTREEAEAWLASKTSR